MLPVLILYIMTQKTHAGMTIGGIKEDLGEETWKGNSPSRSWL